MQEGIKVAFIFGSFSQQGIPGIPGLRWKLLCAPSPLVISALLLPPKEGLPWRSLACLLLQSAMESIDKDEPETVHCAAAYLNGIETFWENNSKDEFKKIHRNILIPF